MRLHITVVTCNRLILTKICLESLLAKTEGEYSVTVVDNGSRDGSRDFLLDIAARHDNVTALLLHCNMGVAVAANLGWARLDADYYLKLDNDVEILNGRWLQKLAAFAERNPEVALVGCRLCNWPHKTESVALQSGESFLDSECCNGGCVLVPRSTHERFGFWNEDYGKYGFEDLEYSDRVRLKGGRVGYLPEEGLVRHLGFAGGAVIAAYEREKKSAAKSAKQGEALYVLNKFLFANGIRDVRVDRRYLPRPGTAGEDKSIRFALNERYLPITRLQRAYVGKISYRGLPEGIELDLSALQGGA